MKDKIDRIFSDLKNEVITEKEAQKQVLDLFVVVVPKGTFFCGENELRSKKKCSKQCDTCFHIKNK
jgi:hypothetical protein|tara:strand:+ start:349 stop:546 length:198 start_codon:yes stop_codon:yes gene_type:complete